MEDPELFERCRAGDEGAWARLVARYENLVFSTALQTGLDSEASVDVFQQVWMELHRSILRIRDPRSLPKWLIVTTRRIAYRHAVQSGRWVRDVREDMADPSDRADSVLAALEQRLHIEEAMQAIDARCREVLHVLFFADRKVSYRAAAKKMGVAENSIGSMKTRCLEKLRKILEARA